MSDHGGKTYRPWEPQRYRQEAQSPDAKLPEGDVVFFLLDMVPKLDLRRFYTRALVQLNGDNFLFYNKSLGDLNVEKFTHKHPRSVDGVNDVWHAYPHSSRNLHDIGIARKLDWRLYKRLF